MQQKRVYIHKHFFQKVEYIMLDIYILCDINYIYYVI